MKLSSAHVRGFESFSDSGEVVFADGVNLIVGQNNAGKSALLRALQPELPDHRHRSPERWDDLELPSPEVQLTVSVSGRELENGILRAGQAHIPTPEHTTLHKREFVRDIFSRTSIPVKVTHRLGNTFSSTYPSHGLFVSEPGVGVYYTEVSAVNGAIHVAETNFRGDKDSIAGVVHELWRRNMFYFSPERYGTGEAAHGYTQRLSHNATNLPAVLQTLQGERGAIFQKLVRHLREVFSTVGNLSVTHTPRGTLEVRVWPTEAMERLELSFPLNSCGTGVSQVIALLTAIMTVENAVVIIDEINSFLHPAAIKALLRIIQTDFRGHQYIISTHAPEVISFSNPRTVHLVRRTSYESSVEKLEIENVGQLREMADHLGVSMTDVFAAERIIWVEGPTEELCFPFIYEETTKKPLPRGTVLTSVVATGDFVAKKRDRKLVLEVYRRLSNASMPLVKAVSFSFDAEDLSSTSMAQMSKESQGTIHFLPRRHLECYLIEPGAIASFIADRDSESGASISVEAVAEKLSELAGGVNFTDSGWTGSLDDVRWQSRVNAAKLIARVVAELSEYRVTFNKKNDTLILLQHVLANKPSQLDELADYVHRLVDSQQS